jgi:glycosyltransferase involved in cell wall biosynthesis
MIGVVIAVRDQARYLGEALDSAAAQTVPPEQIVVVDDASTDGTGDLARARGIKTILAAGEGPAIARNLGAAELTTEFITFLDGDDRFTPVHHEKLLAVVGDAAAGHVTQFYDPGREAELAAKHSLIEEPVLGTTLGSLLIRRSAFDRLGGFPTDGHEFFALVQGLGEIPSVDDVVLERRIHGANRSITSRDEIRAEYLKSARAAILAKRETG